MFHAIGPLAQGAEWQPDVLYESATIGGEDTTSDATTPDYITDTVAYDSNSCDQTTACWERAKLTGDWWGYRACCDEQGITYDFDVTSFYFGVASGGLERGFNYAGHGDYVVNMDAGKLGLQEGLFLKLRAEHRFGADINLDTGSFMPATLLTDLPVADSDNLYLTNVLFTQMLSESFAVFFGKLDTLDGDQNAFASGRGKRQFSNTSLVFNPVAMRTIPYSTLGVGFVIFDEGQPVFTYTLLNATDTTRTNGFDELFAEGVAMSAEWRQPVEFYGLPGHQLVGGTWNSRDFISLGQDPRVIYPDVPIAAHAGSWSLYYNFDQYLYADPRNQTRGWGVFGRAGIAENSTNPIEWFLSSGVGGGGMLHDRPADTFGIGWYYIGSSSQIGPLLQTLFGPIGNGARRRIILQCFDHALVPRDPRPSSSDAGPRERRYGDRPGSTCRNQLLMRRNRICLELFPILFLGKIAGRPVLRMAA